MEEHSVVRKRNLSTETSSPSPIKVHRGVSTVTQSLTQGRSNRRGKCGGVEPLGNEFRKWNNYSHFALKSSPW